MAPGEDPGLDGVFAMSGDPQEGLESMARDGVVWDDLCLLLL